jgi:hypothetical protein
MPQILLRTGCGLAAAPRGGAVFALAIRMVKGHLGERGGGLSSIDVADARLDERREIVGVVSSVAASWIRSLELRSGRRQRSPRIGSRERRRRVGRSPDQQPHLRGACESACVSPCSTTQPRAFFPRRRSIRDNVQFCSGLVDLVQGVGRYHGGCHRLAFAGKRFVGLVAQDIA